MPPEIKQRKSTPSAQQRLCALIRAGATLDEAGYVVGARPTTLRRWLEDDPQLRGDVKQAQDDAKSRLGRSRADVAFAPPVRETYLEYLSQGHSHKAAANLCGLDDASLNILIRNDDVLRTEVEHAEAEAEATYVNRIFKDVTDAPLGKGWIPALEWLKRNRSSTWADVQKLEVFGKIERLRRAREELIAEGIEPPPLDQMVTDLQAIAGGKSKSRKFNALPAPSEKTA